MTALVIVGMIIALLPVCVLAWFYSCILHKAGYSRWWCVLTFIPIVNLIMVWVFAYSHWPAQRDEQAIQQP